MCWVIAFALLCARNPFPLDGANGPRVTLSGTFLSRRETQFSPNTQTRATDKLAGRAYIQANKLRDMVKLETIELKKAKLF